MWDRKKKFYILLFMSNRDIVYTWSFMENLSAPTHSGAASLHSQRCARHTGHYPPLCKSCYEPSNAFRRHK